MILKTTVYQKPTQNDMYLHWDSFAPESWKQGTLKTLLLRAHILCSNQHLLEKKIKHPEHVFVKINCYPTWVVRQIAQKVDMESSQIRQHDLIYSVKCPIETCDKNCNVEIGRS